MSTRLGLKLASTNTQLIDLARDAVADGTFDFVELKYVPETDVEPFKRIKAPFGIHMPSERYGVNLGDPSKFDHNVKIINECRAWADALNARYIVVHPDWGSEIATIAVLQAFTDPRITVENLPVDGLNGEKMLGSERPMLQRLGAGKRFGFCLDFVHAIKAANALGVTRRQLIGDLLNIGPTLFHICDCHMTGTTDEHMALGAGEVDYSFVQDCLRGFPDAWVTLETPRTNMESLDEDRANAAFFRAHIAP